jgi:3-hydroxybutyrate dehydrogenase
MADPRFLQGRRALVTGSVGGLGAAMARGLAGAGASVVMTGLETPEAAESARLNVAEAGGGAVDYLQADLGSREAVEALARKAGAVDILVNNAVIRSFAPIEDFPIEGWDNALAVNVSAPFHLTRLLLPGMRAGGYGRIFNMTSVYGSHGVVNRVDYVVSKSAIEGLTRATAMECAGSAVTCHALCPGSVLTPSLEARIRALAEARSLNWEDAKSAFLEGKNPSGRFVEPDNVARVLLLLCGPAGDDMNGAIVPIEGGWLARA